jgi:Bacterial lectin
MKRNRPINTSLLATALAAIGSLASAQAGSFFADFNDGLVPTNATVYGNATVLPSGGYTNSGYLELTTAVGSESAGFILNDLDAGVPVVSFTASYKCLIGGGGYNGADGMSFNFASDLPPGTISQEGAGSGLTVEFDTFDNGLPDTAPSIDVKVGGNEVITAIPPNGVRTGTEWVDVVIQLNPNNTLSVVYDGAYIYSNLDLNAYGYVPTAASQFGIGAATGGLWDNQWVDNLSITTLTNALPYVNSFAPRGRAVATSSPIDIILTDSTAQVDTNKIVLKLDGATIAATITTDGGGDTLIHYVKPGGFALLSTHYISVTFADNATPTPQTNAWAYSFTTVPPNFIPGPYVTVFSDGFENYVSANAPLDKNYAGGNAAPNGSGNPWFGPAPPNARVVGLAEAGITPHSGTNMITGSAAFDGDQNWYNLTYRLRGGGVYYGNCMLDWWFYDPTGAGDSGYRDNVALINYSTVPTTTDYPGTGSLNSGATVYQRATLGGANNLNAGYDSTKYQARNVGSTGYNGGWNNLSTTRTIGWHHARLIAGPPTNNIAMLYYYVDDLVVPAFSQLNTSSRGFNAIEINTGQASTLGFFDDISFALAVPPNLTVTHSGNNAILSWAGSGFTLQSASVVTGPYTDVGTPPTASPYSYDTTTSPKQFFRLRN